MGIDVDGLKSLPVDDKLKIVELLWDDIGASNEPIELRPWQFDEATRRASEMKHDTSIAIDREELWRRVDG